MVSENKIVFYVFPIITLWELSVTMETRVQMGSDPKHYAAFTHPNNASDKIWLQSAHRLPRYSCLKMWTYTDTQTDDGSTGIL